MHNLPRPPELEVWEMIRGAQLSESRACFGIMGEKLRTKFKPLECGSEGFEGGPRLVRLRIVIRILGIPSVRVWE